MALAKPGVIQAISGKVGALEFSVTRSGQVIKHRKPPRVLSTPKYYDSQTLIAARRSLWGELTSDLMAQWEIAASTTPIVNRLGQRHFLTPFALFMRYIWHPTSSEPVDTFKKVPYPAVTTLDSLAVSITQNGLYEITFSTTSTAFPNFGLNIWIARFQSRSLTPHPRRWKYIDTIDHSQTIVSYTPPPYYFDLNFIAGEHVSVMMRPHDYGHWPGQPLIASCVVQSP